MIINCSRSTQFWSRRPKNDESSRVQLQTTWKFDSIYLSVRFLYGLRRLSFYL